MTDSRVEIATPTWTNALGERVDLDDIDREYALNILTMVLLRRGMWGYTDQDIRNDALVQKLRDVVLNGREVGVQDRMRAKRYNFLCKMGGLPYRVRR